MNPSDLHYDGPSFVSLLLGASQGNAEESKGINFTEVFANLTESERVTFLNSPEAMKAVEILSSPENNNNEDHINSLNTLLNTLP
ncbi:MAG: hypothetical protein VW378_06945 [bacterium]